MLLYELLTGHTPFDAKELLAAGFEEMRRTIREKEPPRPSTRLNTLLAAEQSTAASHAVAGEAEDLMRLMERFEVSLDRKPATAAVRARTPVRAMKQTGGRGAAAALKPAAATAEDNWQEF